MIGTIVQILEESDEHAHECRCSECVREAFAYQEDLIADPEPASDDTDSDGSLKLYCVSWLSPTDPPGKQAHAAILYASQASDALSCAVERFGVLELPRVVRVKHVENIVGLEVGIGTEI